MIDSHITILGHHDPNWPEHQAVRDAVIHAEDQLGLVLSTRWLTPEDLADPQHILSGTLAAIIAPAAPRAPTVLCPEILGPLKILRERKIPTLAIQSGFHHMIIEYARHVLGRKQANSITFDDETPTPVIQNLERRGQDVAGTRPHFFGVDLLNDSRLANIYGQPGTYREAFRDQQAVNPDFAAEFARHGAYFPAILHRGDRSLLAAFEVPALPFWIGVAYSPQVSSVPGRPHPLFRGLIEAARLR